MRTPLLAALFALVFFGTPPLLAEDGKGEGEIARSYELKPKPGETGAFEEAYAEHIAWHREKKDHWRWEAWRIITGDKIGQIVVRTPEHVWSDFDGRTEFTRQDRAHFNGGAGQHIERLVGHVTRWRDDLSRWPDEPVELITIYEMHLHDAKLESFMGAVARIHQVLGENEWPGHYAWGIRVAGGDVPLVTLVIPHASWSAIDDIDKSAWEVLEEAVGPQESDWLRERIGDAVKRQTANFAEYVPELSYTPGD